MDRTIIYPGAIPLETDLLSAERDAMVALGHLARTAMGTGTYVDGLACTPTGPASMTVNVAPGCIFSLQTIDGSAFSSLSSDASPLVKIGVNTTTTPFALTAPATSGHSINYLVEAQFLEADGTAVVLPYYNASNPASPYSGPSNTGVAQNTKRTQRVSMQVKAGVSATTGTQATPSVDAGWVGLYVVTVAYGATTVIAGNISTYSAAPFLAAKLPDIPSTVQLQAGNYAADTGTANALAVTLAPVPASYAAMVGVPIRVLKSAASNTGAATINVNGLGAVAITKPDGTAMLAGDLVAGGMYALVGTGTGFMLSGAVRRQGNMQSFTGSGTFTVPAGVFRVRVTVTGGGAGGAGCGAGNAGGGGGAGGTAIGWYDVTPAQSITVTVGAGGSAGASGGGGGGNGGTSSFGALCSATGGAGGGVVLGGGAGGGGTGGNINITGGYGSDGAGAAATTYAGNGGASFWGGGGRGGSGAGGGGIAGQAYGSGGGGAYVSASVGGAGMAGVVEVEW